MDLLFHRYASPFILLDCVIDNCGFLDFIGDFMKSSDKAECWEFFLHKVHDMSFNDFYESLTPQKPMTKQDFETVVKTSQDILNCEFEEVSLNGAF